MQRMWLQNNVQEKDKEMYPFTCALDAFGKLWMEMRSISEAEWRICVIM